MTRANCLEWLELAGKRGYRDGYDEQPALSRLKVARQFIGPVYGKEDANCLIAAYRMLYSVGDEQRRTDVAEASKWVGECAAQVDNKIHPLACNVCGTLHENVYESKRCWNIWHAQTAPDAPVERFDDDTKGGTAK